MTHKKDRQINDFTALILHRTVALLLLTCGGQSSHSIVAMVGDDIILPCQMEPSKDATGLTVEWSRPDLNPSFVHLRRDRVELIPEQNELYKGRTSLFINKLKWGDVSLKLSKVGLSDAGTYRCHIPTSTTDSLVELIVGSVASPDIKLSRASNGVLLECKSKGWHPAPDVSWLDAEGKLLSTGPPETAKSPDGLSTVSSRVTVEKRDSNSFTCRVTQQNINQTRETQIHVPDELFMVQSSSAVRISICLLLCIATVGTLVFLAWKWGLNKSKTTNDSQELRPLMEGVHATAKLEELQTTEGEMQHLEQVIASLMDQKKNLQEQRKKLNSLQQDHKTKIEEGNKLMHDPKIKIKKKTLVSNHSKDLGKTNEGLENLLKHTEELLVATKGLVSKVTERKARLEGKKEQINKQLKKTKVHVEEAQSDLNMTERQGQQTETDQRETEEHGGQTDKNSIEIEGHGGQTGSDPTVAEGHGGQTGSDPTVAEEHRGQTGSDPTVAEEHRGQTGSDPTVAEGHGEQTGSDPIVAEGHGGPTGGDQTLTGGLKEKEKKKKKNGKQGKDKK